MLSAACQRSRIQCARRRLPERDSNTEKPGRREGSSTNPFFTNSCKYIFEKPLYTLSDPSPNTQTDSSVKTPPRVSGPPTLVKKLHTAELGFTILSAPNGSLHMPPTQGHHQKKSNNLLLNAPRLKDRTCSWECKILPFTFKKKKKKKVYLLVFYNQAKGNTPFPNVVGGAENLFNNPISTKCRAVLQEEIQTSPWSRFSSAGEVTLVPSILQVSHYQGAQILGTRSRQAPLPSYP